MGNNHKFMHYFRKFNPLLKNANSFYTVWVVCENEVQEDYVLCCANQKHKLSFRTENQLHPDW